MTDWDPADIELTVNGKPVEPVDEKAWLSIRLDAPKNTRDEDVAKILAMLRIAIIAAEASGGTAEEFLGQLDEGGSIIAFGPNADEPDEVWLPGDFWLAHAPEAKA